MSQAGVIRTVLGDVEPESLGALDYHEHLFQVSPMLPGDELNDETLSQVEARSLCEAGIGAMIDATPTGLGRNVEAVARISAATGLAIIHATGAHHAGHYLAKDPFLARSVDELSSIFIRDITNGFTVAPDQYARTFSDEPIRAGIAKAGIRYWSIGVFERRVLEAVSMTHLVTGCPIMIHLDYGSASHEVLDVLEGFGVRADRVVLAHIDRNLDPGLHSSLAERGAYLGYDGMARHREAPDSAILSCLSSVVSLGGGKRIVLGGDVARSSRYRSYGGIPGLDYLPLRFMPRLRQVVSERTYRWITVTNGAELLTMPVMAHSG
jgi:phosphotriesterase-related protein